MIKNLKKDIVEIPMYSWNKVWLICYAGEKFRKIENLRRKRTLLVISATFKSLDAPVLWKHILLCALYIYSVHVSNVVQSL